MERIRVSPTKSNLIRLREELGFAREGKSLLTQKREVLVMELLRLQDDAGRAREELEDLLAKAYQAFGEAVALTGFDPLARLSLAVPPPPPTKVVERTVMGVVVPILEEGKPEGGGRPAYGPAAVPLPVDHAVRLFREVRKKLVEVAEIETAIYRLAVETRKTLRRERALENLFIPQYSETVKYIEENLEERDRESFYQMKLLKGKDQT